MEIIVISRVMRWEVNVVNSIVSHGTIIIEKMN